MVYASNKETSDKERLTILSMPLVEAYNGSTDTRLFVGGNGNVCYFGSILFFFYMHRFIALYTMIVIMITDFYFKLPEQPLAQEKG